MNRSGDIFGECVTLKEVIKKTEEILCHHFLMENYIHLGKLG